MPEYMCGNCVRYIPDLRNSIGGYCIPRHRYTYYYDRACESFMYRDFNNMYRILEDKGILYCFECRVAIYNKISLDSHINHLVAGDVYVNEETLKELCCAD